MTRATPPSDWVVYAVVLGTVAAMLLGKYLMFFDNSETPAEKLDDEAEHIVEDAIDEFIEETVENDKPKNS
ncbi:MAG: hypothetical protein U9Q04_10435 [Campylobacterota bacterium]|nr:hypothetical protein [Campylobacterota bacterium]